MRISDWSSDVCSSDLIRVVPIAADAEALQLLALGIHPLLGIGPAFGTKFLDRNLVLVQLFLAILFLDLPLDRQAVAVPAGDVGRVLALQRLGEDDHVFQDRVEVGSASGRERGCQYV